ncbi:MAG: CBS domain-containing protein [Polyangiales bacterium]
MKVSFFLTPKAEVACVSTEATVRQAIEKMEAHQYTAVPLLNRDGTYAGTLTEGDLLYFMKQHPYVRFDDTEDYPLAAVTRRMQVDPIHVDAEIEELLSRAVQQNFVPVVDDREVFIGIVRRSAILSHFQKQLPRM